MFTLEDSQGIILNRAISINFLKFNLLCLESNNFDVFILIWRSLTLYEIFLVYLISLTDCQYRHLYIHSWRLKMLLTIRAHIFSFLKNIFIIDTFRTFKYHVVLLQYFFIIVFYVINIDFTIYPYPCPHSMSTRAVEFIDIYEMCSVF
jgi:hypothetical protein